MKGWGPGPCLLKGWGKLLRGGVSLFYIWLCLKRMGCLLTACPSSRELGVAPLVLQVMGLPISGIIPSSRGMGPGAIHYLKGGDLPPRGWLISLGALLAPLSLQGMGLPFFGVIPLLLDGSCTIVRVPFFLEVFSLGMGFLLAGVPYPLGIPDPSFSRDVVHVLGCSSLWDLDSPSLACGSPPLGRPTSRGWGPVLCLLEG